MEINEQYMGSIKILHIAVAAIKDKFYDTLFSKQLDTGIDISGVFIPCSSRLINDEMLCRFDNYEKNINVVLSPIKTNLDRILYFSKIRKYAKQCESSMDISSCNLMHAHHLFSDGGVAYLLHKKFNIPYVVSVRTTDTEYFMKYFIHTKKFIYKVLDSAEQVICINPIIKEKLLNGIKNISLREAVERKLYVIPNGVNNFWIENKYYKMRNQLPKLHLVQVGSLIPRKNFKCTILAVRKLIDNGYNVELDIVGEGKEKNNLVKLCEKNNLNNIVNFHGFIKDKEKLLSIYRNADFFILPSFTETFGIAYIEAMSQGLPVIYTRNQGIDGFYKELEVGAHVDPNSPDSVAMAILELSKNYMITSSRCTEASLNYKWDEIMIHLKDIYLEAISKNRGYINENKC